MVIHQGKSYFLPNITYLYQALTKKKEKKVWGGKTRINNRKNHCCQRSRVVGGGEITYTVLSLVRPEEGAVCIARRRLSFIIRHREFFEN